MRQYAPLPILRGRMYFIIYNIPRKHMNANVSAETRAISPYLYAKKDDVKGGGR